MEDGFVEKNMGYVDPAIAGKSSIAQTEEVARQAAADTHKIAKLEGEAAEAPKAADSSLGVVADIAMDALGLGAVGKMASAGVMVAEDRIGGGHAGGSSMPAGNEAPAEDAFAKLHKDTMRSPGLYREQSPQTGSYGGNPKAATFPAASTAKTSGLFERASIASSTLQKQDSAGLVDASPKNLATMKSDDAAQKITARVTQTKEHVTALKNVHQHALNSVAPAMAANLAARGQAMKMAPGLAMNGPSFRPDEITAAVSKWDDPNRWRTDQA